MAVLALNNITKKYGETYAVKNVSFTVQDGEFLTIVGPSGCGKTTLLRMIAGLADPTEGKIAIDEEALVDIENGVAPTEPEKRDFGMVFQSYAVWPHMNVFDNVAYPLKIKKISKEEIKTRVMEMLALVHMDGLEKRMAHELSGGQQQRVALARALVMQPRLLLLDESLSNLDAALREEMRDEIKDIQKKLGITIINVTHDQTEALAMSDKVAIMKNGELIQFATPREMYKNPANTFVAKFLGAYNIIKAEVENEGKQGYLAVKPDDLHFSEQGFEGKVVKKQFQGKENVYFVEIEDGSMIRINADIDAEYQEGETIHFVMEHVVWLNE